MLKPVTSELTTEVEKFIIAEKEKYKLSKISQVFLINQSNRIKFLGQKIQQAVGLPTGVLDLAPYITKTQGVIAAGNDLSGFVGAIGGTLR
jgi:Tfp pilus assembly PilM family ATPase